jgi:hypothetical protein
MSSTVATVAITSGSTLAGVVLGFVGNLVRDQRQKRHDRDTTRQEVRAAARLVWLEIVAFETATHVAADTPRLVNDDLVIEPLRTRDQLDRYLVILARERAFDIAAIEHAYTSARYAADALIAGAPPRETRDSYQEAFAGGLKALESLAEIDSDHVSAVQRRVVDQPDGVG